MKKFFALLLCLSLFVPALAESCAICGGDAVCDTCNGLGYQEMEAYGGGMVKVACTRENCNDGKCLICAAQGTDPQSAHTFVDPQIEKAVREALGKPEGKITYEDLLQVQTLNCMGGTNTVESIADLAYMPNLTTLELRSNRIHDISVLAGMTNLTWLNLSGNKVSDISALEGLTNLTVLALSYNNISDISALEGLTNLTVLYLSNLEIKDISPLKELVNLTELYLEDTEIKDIGPLKKLVNLEKLNLNDTEIKDISLLQKMKKLWELRLVDTDVEDISVLKQLSNLTCLYLQSNGSNDIKKLAELTAAPKPTATPRPVSRRECPECDGSGKCSECGGDMWVWKTDWVYVNGLPEMKTVNKLCQGRYCYGGSCDKCGGDGWID